MINYKISVTFPLDMPPESFQFSFDISGKKINNFFYLSVRYNHRIKDDRMENYGAYIVFISKYSIAVQQKNVLADRSLCSRQQIL